MAREAEHTENEPFRRLIDRPHEAMKTIFANHHRKLTYFVRIYISGDDGLVEDVVSETLAAIWEDRKNVAVKNNPVVWMLGIAKRKARYRLREQGKFNALPLDDYLMLEGGEEADRELEYTDLKRLITEAAGDLSPKMKEIFLQSKVEGLSITELTERHDLAEQTIKNKVAQALKYIRRALKDIVGTIAI